MDEAKIYIRRIKGSNDFVHPIEGDELRLLRRYLAIRQQKSSHYLPWLFLSEQEGQLHRNTVIDIVKQASKHAGTGHIHPHMLRHGCGYHLANKGAPLRVIQDYLGHKEINNTVRYTKIS